jgi:hypothetical protein
MGGDPPDVAEGIPHATHPLSIELVGRFSLRLCAGLDGPLVRGVGIWHIQKEIRGPGSRVIAWLADHDDRIADPYFRMREPAVGCRVPQDFLAVESLLHEHDEIGCSGDGQIRSDGVIAVWDGIGTGRHGDSFMQISDSAATACRATKKSNTLK